MNKKYFALAVLSLVVFSVAFIAGCSTSPGGTAIAPFAANWWVDGVSGSDTNSGSGYTSPFKTIMKAMSVVGTGEKIGVLAATYNEYILWPSRNNVSLIGDLSSGYVIIDGQGQHRCVSVEGLTGVSSLTIKNMTITNGSIEVDASALYGGAGMYINQVGLKANLNNVKFYSNGNTIVQGGGGGLFIGQPSTSGIRPTVEAMKCVFYNNKAKNNGGAIATYWADIIMSSCEVDNNSAMSGGGIFLNKGTGRMVNTAVFANKATTTFAGGLNCQADGLPTFEVINCTFASNEAETFAGGILGNEVLILNSIIWGNTIESTPTYAKSHDIYSASACNVSYSDIGVTNFFYTSVAGNVNVDPKFNTWPLPGSSTYHVSLKSGESPKSVAYGATIEAGVPSMDFYGTARTTTTEVGYGSGYSMGATEQDNPAP